MNEKPFVKELPGNLFLAPMAGFTDQAFCEVALAHGADVAFTEMVSAEALCRKNQKSYDMAKPAINASFHAIQLFGSEPCRVAQAIDEIRDLNPSWIDLNAGCPVAKVVKTGAGSALIKEPCLVEAMVRAMREAIDHWGKNQTESLFSAQRPLLSIKIRSGWDHAHQNYRETAQAAVRGGVDWITLHPRTKASGYGGEANWAQLSDLVKELANHKTIDGNKVKICGSGDLFTALKGYEMLETTGCDAIMYARGAEGNPWIFDQTKKLLQEFPFEREGGQAWGERKKNLIQDYLYSIEPASDKRLLTAIWHLELACQLHGEESGVRSMRKQLSVYTKGFPNAKEIRNEMMRCFTFEECRSLLLTLMDYQ